MIQEAERKIQTYSVRFEEKFNGPSEAREGPESASKV